MTVCWRRPQQHDTLKRRYDCRHGNRIFQLFNYTEKLATLVSYSIPTIWQPFRRKLRVGTISSAGTYGALSLLFSSSVLVCCPRNNPALMQGQQDSSWMERPGNWPDWGPVLIKIALCWNVNCCSLVYFTSVRSHIQQPVGTQIHRTEFVIS
jgi:hypothetical protein